MLNELSQVVATGIVGESRHQHIQPMGKNADVLVASLGSEGKPELVELVEAELGQHLLKFAPANNGPSFPGLNLPTPLRRLDEAPTGDIAVAVERLLALNKNKNASNPAVAEAISRVFDLSKPREFSASQERLFQRSCAELVTALQEKLRDTPAELTNFRGLLAIVETAQPRLGAFADSLAQALVGRIMETDRRMLAVSQAVLFGVLDWKKRTTALGASDYWGEKAKQDKDAKQPIYLDLATPDHRFKRVAHRETGALLNKALLDGDTATTNQESSSDGGWVDAYTGESVPLQDKFPMPKIAELGLFKLFSVNTREVQALERYGLSGSITFPVSASLAQKMNDALLHLASEERRGITCRAIPSAHPDKRDLLVAYLEGEPEFREQMAEMFGGEANVFSDADFAATAQPVIEMLEAKVAVNPSLNVRLLALCSIDKGRKQISLNRSFRVVDVIRAARDWQAGARNVPDISVWFWDKVAKQSVFRSQTSPCPLELASTVNRVWSSDAKGGFSSSFQRAVSSADAYDVFMADSPLARQKAERALALLVQRMSTVLAALGTVRTTHEWTSLSDPVRWQSLKAIALFGILLRQLGHHQQSFMQEPITQIGRLLALADSLHQQYCKHVRKGESPSQLIGNALFNTALEQPVFALARLAERLTPYQAWARTFKSDDPNAGVGLVKYFLGEIAACTAAIRIEELPGRMSDADKAKLLLGYLADHSKNETPKQ